MKINVYVKNFQVPICKDIESLLELEKCLENISYDRIDKIVISDLQNRYYYFNNKSPIDKSKQI